MSTTGARVRDPAGPPTRRAPGPRPPRPAAPRRRRGRDLGSYLFVLPAVAFSALLMAYPLIYVLDLSIHDVNLGNFLTGGAPFAGLDNYLDALGSPELRDALVVSLVYTGGSNLLSVSLGFALAVFFQRRFPGSHTLRAVLLLGWVLPTVVTGTVWRWMLQGENGIVNTVLQGLGVIGGPVHWLTDADTALIAVILSTVWTGTPFAMVLLLAGLESIPPTLYEAARVDGANAWQRFWRITMPIMRPVTLTVMLLCFIITFKTFDSVYIMTRGGPGGATQILPILAYEQAFQFWHFSEGATTTVVLLLVAVILAGLQSWLSRGEGRS